jgi:hypothetical protein
MKKPTVVIVLQGGLLSQVLADEPVEAILVDYDVEGTDEESIVQIQQSYGGERPILEPATGGEQEVQIDPVAVARIRRSFGLPITENPIKLLLLLDTLIKELKGCKTHDDQSMPYVALRNTIRSLLRGANMAEPSDSEVNDAVMAILTSRNVVLL